GLPRIGADESGKGDWFGPLVTAAYRLEEGDVEALRALGVNDSKVLADSASARIAGQLDERGGGEVEVLMPLDYNPRYARLRNVNLLLSEMHGACIRRLHERTGPVPVVIVDQFSPRTAVLERDAHLPAGCRLVTRTKGEADLAVAAASILARAAFVDGLRELSNEFGMTLPPGAGTPVLVAGRAFVRTFGRDALAHVAKLHFATSAQV
ncbi:MAG: ribonuclease HIII, partial [Planctomycetota bacterium]|nr:ribonuclease HIII [Planctomycetota bacterium]